MLLVMGFREFLTHLHELEADDLETAALDSCNDLTHQATLDCIGFC